MTLPPEPKRPTWTPAWKKPKGKLAPWPPASYRREYRVKRGESWLSVAMGFLVPDVKDLIYFNFRTENPREVNWYMWRYLGCREPASDGLNFSFADASPGVLYIPPFGWKRSDHILPLHTRVADEIDRCGPYFPEVWYKNIHISRLDMYAISQAIRNGRVGVIHDPTIPHMAVWLPLANKLVLHTPVFGDLFARVILMHEVVHAIVDMKKTKHIKNWENELLAFATSAQFAYTANDLWAVDRPLHTSGTHRAAYILAYYTHQNGKSVKILEEHNRIEDSFLEPGKPINPFLGLEMAIKHSSPYNDNWWYYINFDGI